MYSHAELHAIGIAGKDRERMERCNYYIGNLWALATEILDRTLLTEEFHKPIMDDMDQQRLRYMGQVKKGSPITHTHEMWSRDYFKTTVRQCQAIQDYLDNPAATSIWWHAVEERAVEAGVWIGKEFIYNDELRRLKPAIMPSKRVKKWASASGFRFDANKDTAPSMRMFGAGSEATGGHSIYGFLDDIIGQNDIEDSLMPKKRRWMQGTVANVMRTDIGWMRGTGTHWDDDDIYCDWKKNSKDWDVRVRACYETDGEPDWKGAPVLYTRPVIEAKRRKMSSFVFACQMMNDPTPAEAKPWDQSKCEHFISLRELSDCQKSIFVLGDPAPAKVGSARGEGEQKRADGTKDDWANAVILWATKKQRSFAVLLDGSFSKDWGMLDGCSEMARLMLKWKTANVGLEVYGGLSPEYERYMRQAASTAGTVGFNWIAFKNSYASGAKNVRFQALSDLAKEERFYICKESCPEEFTEKLMSQLRGWIPLQKGRNSLKFDDLADVTARCTDSALQMFSPQPGWDEPDMFFEDEPVQKISRYCGW